MVLTLLRGFFSGFSGFLPSTKTNTFKFDLNVDQGHKFISPWLLRATVSKYKSLLPVRRPKSNADFVIVLSSAIDVNVSFSYLISFGYKALKGNCVELEVYVIPRTAIA